jgi:hypothetical protein
MAILLGLCGAAVVLGGWTVPWFAAAPTLEQPIAFDHRKHAAGPDGIKCETCHRYSSATTGTFAGLPQVDTCMDCHTIVKRMSPAKLAKKPELAKLKRFAVAAAKVRGAVKAAASHIRWRRVYTQPNYVFFSHRRHTAVAKLACAECHGDVRNMSEPVLRATVNQSMDWCLNCHQQRHASQDCISCHK